MKSTRRTCFRRAGEMGGVAAIAVMSDVGYGCAGGHPMKRCSDIITMHKTERGWLPYVRLRALAFYLTLRVSTAFVTD